MKIEYKWKRAIYNLAWWFGYLTAVLGCLELTLLPITNLRGPLHLILGIVEMLYLEHSRLFKSFREKQEENERREISLGSYYWGETNEN